MNFLNTALAWLVPLALLRLSFGGDSASSQASTTNTTNTTTTTDRRTVADGGAIVLGDGSGLSNSVTDNSTHNVTDLGAIQAAADLSQKAIVGATSLATNASADAWKLGNKALSLGESLTDKAIGEIKSAYSEVKSAYSNANEQAQSVASGNKTLATVGMIVAGVIGLAMLLQGKK